MLRTVLDTNVLVAAMRSSRGASFYLLRRLAEERPWYRPCLSVPLVLEYESALKRIDWVSDREVEGLIDYLCKVGDRREIYFLWRPFLRDPADEMVLEVGVEASADVIVTHNLKDFGGVEERFGIRVVTPGEFLLELKEGEA